MFMFSHPILPFPLRKAPVSIETPIGRAQARATREIARAVIHGIAGLGVEVDFTVLLRAIERNDVEAILALFDMDGLNRALGEAQTSMVELASVGADIGLAALPGTLPLRTEQIVSPFIEPFIERRGAALVRYVTDAQRKTIMELIRTGFREGRLVTETATDIMNTVGLLPQHAMAVQRFRARLLAEGFHPVRAQTTAQGYATRLLRYRGMMIARTESTTALGAGQQEAWEVAAREQLFEESTAQRIWTVFQPCPNICEPIPRRGPVGLREPFITGQGVAVMHAPAHPSCKCNTQLVLP